MSRIVTVLGVIALACVTLGCVGCWASRPAPRRIPKRIVVPVRPVLPRPIPPRPRRPCPGPWCPRGNDCPMPSAVVGGRVSPDGVPIQCDYPGERMKPNVGGSDGKGLCVFDSASWAMDWHRHREGYGLLEWMTRKPGGGWPEKFDAMMAEFWREKGKPAPRYVQMEGDDIPFVIDALAKGKLVCGTYWRSPTGRYQGQRIAHMVCIAHHDGERVAVIDNNFCGADKVEWMSAAEFRKTFLNSSGKGWAIAFDAPPPPPPPHN